MTKILLVHDEMLNESLPVFDLHANLSRVFVLDPLFIANEGWSLKRVQFIVDCLSEIAAVRIFHGALDAVCGELGASEIVTQQTPNHMIREWLATAALPITWVDEPDFVDYCGTPTRFTAYWKSVAPQWFSPDDLRVTERRSQMVKRRK